MRQATWKRPALLKVMAVILLLAAGISGYLAWHHEDQLYGAKSSKLGYCPENDVVNCEIVNTSAYSEVFGFPIAGVGLAFYLFLFWTLYRTRRHPKYAGTLFGMGILSIVYSAVLLYISKFLIGYICLWCASIYVINLSLPPLVLAATGKGAGELLKEFFSVFTKTRELRRLAGSLVVTFGIVLGLQQTVRAEMLQTGNGKVAQRKKAQQRKGKREIASEATPRPPITQEDLSLDKLQAPLRLATAKNKTFVGENFSLREAAGRGKPLALIFWSADQPSSLTALGDWVKYFKEKAKNYTVYAVGGKRREFSAETTLERYLMFSFSKEVPLLIDDNFDTYKALGIDGLPSVALLDKHGKFVVTKLRSPSQMLGFGQKAVKGEDLVRQVASGTETDAILTPPPYFPVTELQGKCAPSFTGYEFSTGKPFHFDGKSANGKPTLLVFWSSTCQHCQKEIPQIVEYQAKHPNDINLVSVTTIKADKEGSMSHRKVTQAYIKNQKIKWPVVEDGNRTIQDLYQVISTPTTVLISPQGRIQGAWLYVHSSFENAVNESMTTLTSKQACEAIPAKNPPGKLTMTVLSPQNKRAELASHITGPTLVHFWATWCEPCQQELPALLKFGEELEKEGGKLLVVSVEDESSAAKISDFEKRMNVQTHSFRAPAGGLSDQMNLGYSLPRTFIVQKGGYVNNSLYGAQNWEDPIFKRKVQTYLQAFKK